MDFCLQDYELGSGEVPEEGQEVEFNYSAYNENGSRVDTSFAKGKAAKTRLGIKGLIPGTPHPHSLALP